MSVRPGYKKRRAPLPEEVYPNLANRASIVLDGSREPTITSNEGQPRILPLGEPVSLFQLIINLFVQFNIGVIKLKFSLPCPPMKRLTIGDILLLRIHLQNDIHRRPIATYPNRRGKTPMILIFCQIMRPLTCMEQVEM